MKEVLPPGLGLKVTREGTLVVYFGSINAKVYLVGCSLLGGDFATHDERVGCNAGGRYQGNLMGLFAWAEVTDRDLDRLGLFLRKVDPVGIGRYPIGVVEVFVVGDEDIAHTIGDEVEDEAAEQELREAVVLRRVGIQDRGEAAGQEQVEEGQGHEVVGAADDLHARAGGVGAA